MKVTERDWKLLTFAPAVLAAVLGWVYLVEPAGVEGKELERRIEAAGSVPAAWEAPRATADQAALAAVQELAAAEAALAAGRAELERERGVAAGARRTKPGALAVLNQAAAASGVTIVSAITRTAAGEEAAGLWDVTFQAGYTAMAACLKELSEQSGVMVRRIDRLSSEDAGAEPIWQLVVQL